jgi:carboxymethylenebutenolidase
MEDARVTETVAPTGELMKQSGKKFEPIVQEGAGYGFMRSGEEGAPTEANKKARDEGWSRWKALLKKI